MADVFEELAALKAEVVRARGLRLSRPADAVDPKVHTPERVLAHLRDRGWTRVDGSDLAERWERPGKPDLQALVALKVHASDYALRVGFLVKDLADVYGLGELQVLADIAGMPQTNWTDVFAARLLPIMRAEGGDWTGTRAAAALLAHQGWDISSQRGVQVMQRLEEQRLVVNTRSPRGRTYRLPDGPADEPWIEWANRRELGGRSEVVPVGPAYEGGGEVLARARMEREWFTVLLRRTVTPGPWVEVPVEQRAEGSW